MQGKEFDLELTDKWYKPLEEIKYWIDYKEWKAYDNWRKQREKR